MKAIRDLVHVSVHPITEHIITKPADSAARTDTWITVDFKGGVITFNFCGRIRGSVTAINTAIIQITNAFFMHVNNAGVVHLFLFGRAFIRGEVTGETSWWKTY
jgi:hypothetical protein